MSLKSSIQNHHIMFLTDLDCPQSDAVLRKASSEDLFKFPFRWLVLTYSKGDKKPSALWNCPLLADSDLVLAYRKNDTFDMVELYKPALNFTMQVNPRGYYNGNLMDFMGYNSLFRRRRDLMGHSLTMANVIQDSNSTKYHLPKENGLEPQHDAIAKICWMNAKLAFEMLNATPRYIFSYRWGYKVNGQWSGMINDLHSERADLGTNCVVSDIERLNVVTYTDMLAPFRVRFIFRQPPLPYVSNIFSLPFRTSVWLAVFICCIISTITIYFATKWEARIVRSPTQLDGTVSDAMLLTMSAVSQQGCAMEPKKASGRIMLWVLFTALMALYAAYSANIVVLLQAPSNSIRTLHQLAHSKMTLAANDVDYNHFIFSLFKDPDHVSIYKIIQPEKGREQFYELNEGVEKIRQGLFAFHSIVEPVYRRVEETFLETEKCDLMEIDFLGSFDPFVPVKKDSPYLELLRVVFKRIRESGIASALAKRLQVEKPKCATKQTAFSSVGLVDFRPVLLLMVYGVAVSVTICLIEIVVHKICMRLHSK
uniref:Ionotropic receptor n=1 Tax=Dendrolimus kikuchii TaxID=765133 RepID=A0A076E9E5_9NEOP|nr:ionotropic receptor [Dendrolimus kikuchii]